MKITTSVLTGLIAFAVGITSVNAAVLTPQVMVYTYKVLGPPTNSVEYADWAAETVAQMYNGQIPNTNNYLATPDFIQGPDKTNSTVWFAVRVVSISPSYKFSPLGLSFQENSSDAGHVFAGSFTYTNSAYIYTPQALGIVWSPSRNPIEDTYPEGSWTNLVNEFFFIGNQSKYFVVNSLSQSNAVDAFFSATNMTITGTFTMNDGVNPAVSASRTLYRNGGPTPPTITMTNNTDNTVTLGIAGSGTNDTWTVQHSASLSPANWSAIATANANWSLANWPKTNSTEFFRLVSQ